ncbi:uncharacterized protein LOC131605729 [Vicia villosa]|uniref:uncharacterized protein LOC131605729 n=1 Tax=Vicia villosa TaxID=3911 RepID=UPI00273BCD3F|nr:uncharacterized protein LOC131605729 [Vicia villosa]
MIELDNILLGVEVKDGTTDTLKWFQDSDGIYTVSSGYVAFNNSCNYILYADSKLKVVSRLWDSLVSSKILVFGWHCIIDRISTRDNLSSWRIITNENDKVCVFCFGNGRSFVVVLGFISRQSGLYGVKETQSSSRLKRVAGLSSVIEPRLNKFNDAKSILLDICMKEDRRVAGRVAVVICALWNNRNNFIWNNERNDYMQVSILAFHSWQDWFKAKHEHLPDSGGNQHQSGWSPPRVGWLKCNVDGGFNRLRKTTNRGIAWDYGLFPTVEAEAMALKEAIQAAVQLRLYQVQFESDSQLVVQAIHARKDGNYEFSLIIKSIKSLLDAFPNFKVKFVNRQANLVVHLLARAVNSWTRRSFVDLIPPCNEQQLLNEMN